ncbi:hypothetical protein BRAS3843_3260093 [Bradyrhizobium sp. STM 3843]|nr:hypothetical protein BRAS3843_3260093 [Bradyrhizobium sp. STM 3843]
MRRLQVDPALMVRDARLCRALTMRVYDLAAKHALVLRSSPEASVSKDGGGSDRRPSPFIHARACRLRGQGANLCPSHYRRNRFSRLGNALEKFGC